MRNLYAFLLCFGLVLGLVAGKSAAQLYGDEKKDVTSGDLNSQDYWWTKFDMMMLDLAIKQHQPEGRIAVDLASTIRRLDDLAKQYPKHEQIKQWKQHAADINAKIDPNANRQLAFNPGCPWDEANFAQLWVNFHWGKMQADAGDANAAYGTFQNVEQNLAIMLAPDRMKDYPEDLRKWVHDTKPDADKIYAELKAKLHQ